MRLGLASLLLVVAVPSIAAAGTITVGVHAGSLQTEVDADNKNDAQSELGAFGRFQLADRVSVQLDIADVSMRDQANLSMTSVTASAVLDLTQGSQFVPVFLVGLGVDSVSSDDYEADSTRSEVGLGVEYRAKNGFLVGIDARLGNRKIGSEEYKAYAVDDLAGDDGGNPIYRDDSDLPSVLSAGQYRSLRLYAGLRF